MLENYELYQFNGRGKCINAMEAIGCALLNLWGLQNTNGKKMTVIRNVATKEIIRVYLGNGKGFPKVVDKKEDIEALGINIIGEEE